MDGSTTSSRNHSGNALHHGECSVLHAQSRPRPGSFLSQIHFHLRLSLSRNCLNLCDSDFESSNFLCDCDLGKLKFVMFWAAEARWERHVGRGHGEKGQEARGAGVCSYPEVDCLSGTHLFQFWVPSWDRFF